MVACIWFLCWLCQIKHHTEINEREECLDENESLRITSSLVETRQWCVSINFGRVNAARAVKERKKVKESSIGAGDVEEKGWHVTKHGWHMTTNVWITPGWLAEVACALVAFTAILVSCLITEECLAWFYGVICRSLQRIWWYASTTARCS